MKQKQDLRVPPEIEDVVNLVGDFIEYWGFKNVHGRIWAHVFLSPVPLDAGQLVSRLGVSKALVSMSVSELLEYEVIQVAGKSDRGTVVYKSNPDLTGVIMGVLRQRERRLLCRLSASMKVLHGRPENTPNTIPLSPERLAVLKQMIKTAERTLDGLLQMNEVSFRDLAEFTDIR